MCTRVRASAWDRDGDFFFVFFIKFMVCVLNKWREMIRRRRYVVASWSLVTARNYENFNTTHSPRCNGSCQTNINLLKLKINFRLARPKWIYVSKLCDNNFSYSTYGPNETTHTHTHNKTLNLVNHIGHWKRSCLFVDLQQLFVFRRQSFVARFIISNNIINKFSPPE